MAKVFVADDLDAAAIALLRQHLEVQYRPGLSESELVEAVTDADALIVRSSSKVTHQVIEAGQKLRVIGRAGAGVDNIDLEAATERGLWVVNAPDSNSVAVAEHAFALMLALARKIPWAWQSLQKGEWKRSAFRGCELAGKSLGIIGLGRIGTKVAERARAFGMRALAYDPFIAPDRASAIGAELVSLEELLSQSDFISLHVPSSPTTVGLISERQLKLCKSSAFLINCSRGAVVDEQALLQALDSDRIAGAALDVFAQEPPHSSPLLQHPKIIVTPHIAGMTEEAQQNVALAVAQQVLDVLEGRQPRYPVNAPALSAEQQRRIGPYLDLARRLGRFYAAIASAPTVAVQLTCAGQAAEMETSLLMAALLEGLLAQVSETPVNLINARIIARNRGITVSETTSAQAGPYSSLLSLAVSTTDRRLCISGTIMHGQPYIVKIGDFWISFVPAGTLLYTEHVEQPGILGRMGTLLGDHGINISFVQVGRHTRGGRGIMIMGVDDVLSEGVLAAVAQLPSVVCARMVNLPPGLP